MSLNPAQLQNFFLYGGGVSIGDTTVTLQSFQSIDGVDLSLADFGTIGYMTIEPGTGDREEQISFTGVTQNANGTATLTGIKTVLFLTPYTETSGFSKSHPAGVIAVVSNTSGYYNNFPIKSNNEAITAYWTVPDPVGLTDIANKQYVLSVVSGGAISVNTIIVSATAGETVIAGQVLYLKIADGRWWKSDATVTSTVSGVQLGIAQGSGTAGNAITGGVLIRGVDTHQSGIVGGTVYYVRDGGGLPSASAGTISRAIANGGQSATTIYFDPTFDFQSLASTTLKGIVEEATQSEVDAGTAVGGTGARLYVNPATFKASTVPTIQAFTGSNTWTKPANLKYVVVRLVGAGGGGGGSSATANSAGGGGGGGGYSEKLILEATLGATETVTIGAAGAAGTSTGSGGAGGTTSFGAHCQATGGGGGDVGGGESSGSNGGVGSGGDLNTVGDGSQGANIASAAGKGGSSLLGGGSRSPSNNVGIDATGYGGGGSGGSNNGGAVAGGAGMTGYCIVYNYYS